MAMSITIELPEDVERSLKRRARAQGKPVESYVRQVLERDLRSRTASEPPDERPIWEVILDNTKTVAPEVFEKLPTDGARQVDHYLYGHPKR